MSFVHVDSRGVDESSRLILDDLLDGWMVVSQHNLSIIRLEVDISVSLVIEEILEVSFSDDQRLFVVSLI